MWKVGWKKGILGKCDGEEYFEKVYWEKDIVGMCDGRVVVGESVLGESMMG